MVTKLNPLEQRMLADWKVLCQEIGERLAGTESEWRAAEYILSQFEEASCKNCKIETFPCNSRQSSLVSVQVPVG